MTEYHYEVNSGQQEIRAGGLRKLPCQLDSVPEH